MQGGFLLASQLYKPEPLSALKKEDWKHVGHPIIQAITEICGQLGVINHDGRLWRKRILCILWSKILENAKGEDVDIRWRENPLFAIQNSLPDFNHTVMFEVIKSMGFFSIYVELLNCFESVQQCTELRKLVQHVTRDSTDVDVRFLLEVWWEMLKGQKETEDNLDQVFTAQCVHYTQTIPDCSPQASKRFKPDPDLDVSITCIMSILFRGLRDIKDAITSPEMCYFALSNCLDMLYTSCLLNRVTDLPAEVKIQNIVRSVGLRKLHNPLEVVDLTQAIYESHRDLAAVLTPAQNKPCGITLIQAMDTVLEVAHIWEDKGLLSMPTNAQSPLAIRLKDSLGRVLQSLEDQAGNLEGNAQTVDSLKKSLEHLLASLSFNVSESPSNEVARVVITIIDSNMKGFEDLPKLFASKLSQTFIDTEWLSCLERNKGTFQNKDLVMALVSTLISKCQSNADVKHCKKLKDIVVEIFSQLPLPEKNAILSEILTLSKKGLHGCLPNSITTGFSEELNLAFNCIIQGEAKSSLSSAVNAVARVAFQNPEATIHRCCHMAVVNLGAHTLLAQILQQLSGFMSPSSDQTRTYNKENNLLCRCLQDMWNKLSSSQEEDQFLCFLSTLMEYNFTAQSGEELSFLLPEEIVHAFVLPYLSFSCPQPCRLEVCLRLFQLALARISRDNDTHWIMNCSPFALLYCVAQLLNNCSKCWEQPLEGDLVLSLESKELLISILTTMGKVVGKEVAQAPSTWSRALSWLYAKVEELDWTVRIHLKGVWREHFKYEVPTTLLAVSELSEQEWSGLVLPHYGQGTGLLAWIECCCLSDHIQEIMLDSLSLNLLNPDEVTMFSKGLLVAVSQVLPWCTVGEWQRLLTVLHELLQSDRLHVPYSLEYVDFLPLLDLRSFAHDLQVSVFLLRMFQLLCGSSCAGWLPPQGWAHVGRLCGTAMKGIIDSVKNKLPIKSTNTTTPKSPVMSSGNLSKEVLFVLTQLFCHTLHLQVMISGQPEPLFLCALDILSHYEAVMSAYPKSSSALQVANTRHFLTTITDNLQCTDMRAVLHQKIAQL